MASGDENKKPDAGKVGGGDKKEAKKMTKEERKKEEEMVMGILPANWLPSGLSLRCCSHPPHDTFSSHLADAGRGRATPRPALMPRWNLGGLLNFSRAKPPPSVSCFLLHRGVGQVPPRVAV